MESVQLGIFVRLIGADLGELPFQQLGETSKTVTVNVSGETIKEANEQFTVKLSNSTGGATIFDEQGIGTILNDDGPILRITDVRKAEGNSGKTVFTFAVTLSPASMGPVVVSYATADNTAKAGSDYTWAGGLLTFLPGQRSTLVLVSVVGDSTPEGNEVFNVNLFGALGATIFDGQGIGVIPNDE